MSNDEYKSVDHRALANASLEPRMSVAVFYYPSDCESSFGSLPELVSPEKPAVYRQFKVGDYLKTFYTNELDGKSLKNYFRA
ncbi:uncharacterized protein J3R85_007959 [Psidium guajava]|nr:uncharacterized protein J3R85_007959 [Psidium guajava]